MSITKYGAPKDQISKTASGDGGSWSGVDPKADTEILPAVEVKKKDKPTESDKVTKE
jgi:hypothetical protein